jgi:plasmid stabilization system protein ParE
LIEWSETVHLDFAEISAYFIGKGETAVGNKIIAEIYKATRRLKTSPLSGRPGLDPGTREIVLLKIPYIIVYEIIDKKDTRILRVFHASQLRPESTNDEEGRQYH